MNKYTRVVSDEAGSPLTIRNVIEYLVIFGLLSSVLLPPLQVGGFTTYLTIFFSLMVFLLVVVFWASRILLVDRSVMFPALMTFMVITISFFSWAIGFSNVHSGDVFESIKYAQYIPFFLAIPFIQVNTFARKFKMVLTPSLVFFLIVCTLQSFPQLGAVSAVSLAYLGADSVHLEGALSGYRLTFTGADPNIGAAITYFFVMIYLAKYLLHKELTSLFVACVLLFFALQTQSRTSMIGFAVSFSIFFFVFYKTGMISKIVLFSLISCVVVFMFLYLDLDYVVAGFFLTLTGDNESLNIRLGNVLTAIEIFQLSPLIGYGPAKSHMDTVIDSEYALIIQRYGMVGILVFFSFIVFLFKVSVRVVGQYYGAALFMFTVFSLFFMTTNNIFSGYQLMSLIVILMIFCIVSFRDNIHA